MNGQKHSSNIKHVASEDTPENKTLWLTLNKVKYFVFTCYINDIASVRHVMFLLRVCTVLGVYDDTFDDVGTPKFN